MENAAVPSASSQLVRLCIGIAFILLAGAPPARSQAQPPEIVIPRFEVASVKPHLSKADPSKISSTTPGRFTATNTPLWFLILYAYEIPEYQLIGAPDWTYESAFDIVGTYSPGRQPTDHETRLMLQNLLAERFSLKLHHEQRELPTYALVLARKDGHLGPQLQRSDVDCVKWTEAKRPKTDAGGPSPVSPSGKRPACMMIATRTYLTGGARTMEEIAKTLHAMVARPVADRTGLTGVFDVDLRWSRYDLSADAAASDSPNDSPSIFAALQEQLGLKLVPQRDNFDVLVLDDVTRPAAN
jgi:bla regulator protein blaR1